MMGDFDGSHYMSTARGVIVIEWLLPLLFYFYLIFSLLVLLNLIIAVMSTTYEQLSDRARTEWSFARLQLVIEYKVLDDIPQHVPFVCPSRIHH